MKRLILCSLLLIGSVCRAQSTAVTATITDSDGFLWSNGSYQITFVPNPAFPSIGSYVWSGGNLQQNSIFNGNMNGSGVLSQTIPSSTSISPSGSSWRYDLCPNASSGCVSVNIASTGATQDLSAQLSATAKGPRFAANPVAFGYGVVEVSPVPLPGAIFFDTTNNGCNQWGTAEWQDCGGGGGINPAAPNLSAYYDAAGTNLVGQQPYLCPAGSDPATCVAGSTGGLVIPAGVTGSYLQASSIPATAGCIADSTTGQLSIQALNLGFGYVTPPTVTVVPNSGITPGIIGSITANLTGSRVTSYTVTGSSGWGPDTGHGGLCPVQVVVTAPPAAPAPIAVANYNKGEYTYRSVINVDDFGAVGDGVTCDDQAINNAIRFATVDGIHPGAISFTAGGNKIYNTCGIAGYYPGGGDDGTVPIAATLSITSSTTCSVTSPGSTLNTNNITSLGTGTGATITATLSSGSVASCTVSGGSGYSFPYTAYAGPTCSGVPCTILPPIVPAQIGYSIAIPSALTIYGNGATLKGGFTGSFATATDYDNNYPYVAVLGGQFQNNNHVSIYDLKITTAFIGLGNMGNDWIISSFDCTCAIIGQGQSSQFSDIRDVNVKTQTQTRGGFALGGEWLTRAPATSTQGLVVINNSDILDGFSIDNYFLWTGPSSSAATFNRDRRALDCWFDKNFFMVENQGITNSDNCFTPPGGIVRMTDQDLALQYVPDDMWRGTYGIAMAAYSRYGRPINGFYMNNVDSKGAPSHSVVIGPGSFSTNGTLITVESGGRCTSGVAYGNAACPNPYVPQNVVPDCIVIHTGASDQFSSVAGQFFATSVCQPWNSPQTFSEADYQITGALASVPSLNPTYPPGTSGGSSVIASRFIPFDQNQHALNGDSTGFSQKNTKNQATVIGEEKWNEFTRDSIYPPDTTAVARQTVHEFSAWFNGVLDPMAVVKMPGLRVNPNAMAGGQVTAITITNGGNGYTPFAAVPCTIAASPLLLPASTTNFYQSDCQGIADKTGTVKTAYCSRCGVGYTSAPAVTFTAPVSGVTATGTTTINSIDQEGALEHVATCSFFLNAGGTVAANTVATLTGVSCPGAIFSSHHNYGDWARVIANGTGSTGGLMISAEVTANNTITVKLINPTNAGITYAAGTAQDSWVVELVSGNTQTGLVAAVTTPTITTAPYGGSSLPSCTTNQLIYYASAGTAGTCLTLGTNLSITTGTLNASATAATNFSALTSGTNTLAAMTVGSGASLAASGSGTITATAAPFTGLTGNLGTAQGPTSLTGLLKDTAGTLSAATAGTDYLTPTGSATGLSKASSAAFGVSECDGTTITCSGGIFTATGGTPAYPLTITGGVSGGVVYGSSATQLTVSPAGTANVVMAWGGAATAPKNTSIADNGTTVATTEPMSVGSSLSTTADGVHPSTASFVGNTTLPTLGANTFNIIGPPTTGFTTYGLQAPNSMSAGILHVGTPTSSVLPLTSSAVSLTADVSGVLPSTNGGTGVNNTATLTLGSSNQNWATLGTGIVKNTTTTGALSNAASSDLIALFTGTCSSATFLRGDGACAAPSASVTWNGISNPTGNQALSMGANTTTWTWGTTGAGSSDAVTLTDTSPSTGSGYLLHIMTGATSSMKPVCFGVNGTGCNFSVNQFGGVTSSGITTTGVNINGPLATFVMTGTFAASLTIPTSTSWYRIVLTGSVTSSTIAAGTDGQELCMDIAQNATGSFTFAWPTNMHGVFTIGATASKDNVQCFKYSTGATAWLALSTGVTNE